jgi:hypothetical protein
MGRRSDTIELYNPDTDLSLGSVISTLTTAVDQANFDTITFERGDGVLMDEVRFGASADEVLGIPEPASLALLGLGGLAMLRRRSA